MRYSRANIYIHIIVSFTLYPRMECLGFRSLVGKKRLYLFLIDGRQRPVGDAGSEGGASIMFIFIIFPLYFQLIFIVRPNNGNPLPPSPPPTPFAIIFISIFRTTHLPEDEGPSSWSFRSAAVTSTSEPPDRNATPLLGPTTPGPPATTVPILPPMLPLATPTPSTPPPPAPKPLRSSAFKASSAADKAWQMRTSRRASPPGVTRVCRATFGGRRGGREGALFFLCFCSQSMGTPAEEVQRPAKKYSRNGVTGCLYCE